MLLWEPDAIAPGGARYATVVQVVDSDRVSNPYQMLDTHQLRGGVEVDELGAPVAYHIRRAHQNDWYDAQESLVWERFSRWTPWGRPIVVHTKEMGPTAGRGMQHRGIGLLTEVLGRFRMLNKYDTSSLQSAVLRALVGFFVKSPYDAEQIGEAMRAYEDGDR